MLIHSRIRASNVCRIFLRYIYKPSAARKKNPNKDGDILFSRTKKDRIGIFTRATMRSRRDHQQLAYDARTDDYLPKTSLSRPQGPKHPIPQRKGRTGQDGWRRADDDGDAASNSKEDIPMRAKKQKRKAPLATKATRITIIPSRGIKLVR